MEVASLIVGYAAAYEDYKHGSGGQRGIDVAASALASVRVAARLSGEIPQIVKAAAPVEEAAAHDPCVKSLAELLDRVSELSLRLRQPPEPFNGVADDDR